MINSRFTLITHRFTDLQVQLYTLLESPTSLMNVAN